MARAQATTNHEVIRSWIESRKGHPSVVRATEGRKQGSSGLLRVDFDEPEDALEEISWDDFFDTFDSNELAFLYQDTTAAGRKSRFHKFVSRDTVEASDDLEESEESGGQSRAQSASAKSGAKSRQASEQEEEEAEEADEEDLEDEDEDEEDEDLEEDEDEDEEEDEDFDEDDEDLEDDEDEEEEEEEEEEDKPRRRR